MNVASDMFEVKKKVTDIFTVLLILGLMPKRLIV